MKVSTPSDLFVLIALIVVPSTSIVEAFIGGKSISSTKSFGAGRQQQQRIIQEHNYNFYHASLSPLSLRNGRRSRTRNRRSTSHTILFYERDPPSDGKNDVFNTWSVLADTEKWISKTLESANSSNGSNPYARKEVSYVCETHAESPMIIAGIFRRLREAREQGERHGMAEEDRSIDLGEKYNPMTLRQTQVIVIPSNPALRESFHDFDKCINSINAARRNARDYVTDVAFEKLDERMYGDGDRDWSVSVNCAHLHPEFGKKTPEQLLKEMKEEEAGEVDLNMKEYQKKRTMARQSPFPTVVVEVRATPPPDFGSSPAPTSSANSKNTKPESGVNSEEIKKLEALFGKSAHMDHPMSSREKSPRSAEDDFFNAIGDVIEEIASVSPLSIGQTWIHENDETFNVEDSAFTVSNARHVDEAYEFVFTNLAMQIAGKQGNGIGARKFYLVMPTYLSSSATSLEKFSVEVMKIINVLPDLDGKVEISTFHPEHVNSEKRSPMPILAFDYDKN